MAAVSMATMDSDDVDVDGTRRSYSTSENSAGLKKPVDDTAVMVDYSRRLLAFGVLCQYLKKPVDDTVEMIGYTKRLLAFAILYAWFFAFRSFVNFVEIGPIVLEDVFAMMGSIVIAPFWLDFFLNNKSIRQRNPGRRELVLFIVNLAAWCYGNGLHTSSNSISRIAYSPPFEGTAVDEVTFFWDERTGHIFPFLSLYGLLAFTVYTQVISPFDILTTESEGGEKGFLQTRFRKQHGMVGAAGVVFGFVFFLNMVEGQFPIPGFVYAILQLGFQIYNAAYKKRFAYSPVFLFTTVWSSMMVLLTFIWLGINNGGLPEFSEVGLI